MEKESKINIEVLLNTNICKSLNEKIKGVCFRIEKNRIYFAFELSKKLKTYQITGNKQKIARLFKSLLTIYLIKHGEPLKINQLNLIENKKHKAKFLYDEINKFPIYGMVENKLEKSICYLLENKNIYNGLFEAESNPIRAIVSLYIVGLSKIYENDKFYYLFSSFNAIVNLKCKGNKFDRDKYTKYFAEVGNCNNEMLERKQGEALLGKFESFLDSKTYTFKFLITNTNDVMKEFILQFNAEYDEGLLEEFFKYQFVYYLRCKIMHGQQSAILYTFKKESSFVLLQYANHTLINLIEQSLLSM